MELLISLILGLLFVLLCSKSIARNRLNYYLGTILLGILLLIFPIINQRYLGLALLVLVMYTSVFNHNNDFVKKILVIRGPIAIMAFEFIAFHAFKNLLKGNYKLYGIIAFAMLFPLFITSFNKIRIKIGSHAWKTLHKLAYIAFIVVYIHITLEAEFVDQIIYSVIIVGYYILRVVKFIKIKKAKIILDKSNKVL